MSIHLSDKETTPSTEDKSKFVQFKLKCKAGSAGSNTPTYKKSFHTFNKGRKGVTVTIPLTERAFNQNKLRLLCSITGKTKRKSNLTFRVVLSAFIFAAGTSKAEWKDVTDKVELVFGTSCVQFETAVTGRFWLLESQSTENTTSEFESMATKLYYETIQYDQ